ncbi:YfdQ family protein [Acinetobacter junii]|uniref:YfdQ family protein n=1 Tax=Acinetobacter junii TaxID=40215 RepID=UPI0021CD6500|nr:YfdQ family protein [Acinetobacter junii]MCU4406677.1 YfdQ family protein [Acinetobacter junii]
MSEANNSSECQNAYTLGQTSLQHTKQLPFIVIPDNGRVHTFEDVLERPLQLEQSVKLDTAKDFIKYVDRFADRDSIIFVNVLGGRFKAVLDYHEVEKKSDDGVVANPRHGKHVANFVVEKTSEFKKIEASSGEKFTQTQFALFLEDVMPYINKPDAAELYEIVQTLNAKTNVDFKSGIRTDNGQVQLTYNETIEARAGVSGNLTIPEQIVFGIQVHRGGEHYALPARFRHRIKDGAITFWYDLDQLEKAIEKSMEDTIDYIRNGKTILKDDQEVELPGVPKYVTILEGSV